MIAAVLDLHIGAMAAKAVDQMARCFPHRHDVIDLHPFGHADQVGRSNPAPGVGLHLFVVADDPGHFGHGGKGLRLCLGRTAGDDDRRARILAVQLADLLLGLAHRLGRDGTGVDDHRIRQPGSSGEVLHRLRLIGIETAAKRGKNRGVHLWAAT